MWVQSETFICPYIVLNLNISLNFCATLSFNVIWFAKSMKIRKLKIEIISIYIAQFIDWHNPLSSFSINVNKGY